MVDTTSLRALHETFPEISKQVAPLLWLEPIAPRARLSAAAALARHGYLGCYPIGNSNYNKESLVLRLRPGRAPAEASIVETRGKLDGTTIAHGLRFWAAARLAWIESQAKRAKIPRSQEAALLALAAQFGDDEAMARVLLAVGRLRKVEKRRDRVPPLLEAVDPGSTFYSAVVAATTRIDATLRAWFDNHTELLAAEPIAAGLYVSFHTFYETGVDVTEHAWRVLSADAVADFTYSGLMPAQGLEWSDAPLLRAVKALSKTKLTGLPKSKAAALKAARAFARNPTKYSGSLHLATAKVLASVDPVKAYGQAANAAAFRARSGGSVPVQAIKIARAIADAQSWADISLILDRVKE